MAIATDPIADLSPSQFPQMQSRRTDVFGPPSPELEPLHAYDRRQHPNKPAAWDPT
jgi:hypothetical protein